MTEFSPDSLLSQPVPASKSGGTTLSVAVEAAKLAGEVILQRLHTVKDVKFKGAKDVVTDVDLEAERVALAVLRREYPDFSILSEESEPISTGSPYTWVVDPLDGTRNYASGIPHVSVVVGLALGGEMVVGVTHDPVRDEAFTAEKGKGAFLNGSPLSISSRKELPECLLGFDMGYVDEKGALALDMIRTLWPDMQGMRIMGSGALGLAYAACGRLDIYFHHRLFPWDVASGLLLVSEAGGTVVDRYGDSATLDSQSVIASSPQLVAGFLKATEGLEWRK